MNSKDKAFWRSHMKEAAMRNLNASESAVESVLEMMVTVGDSDLDSALHKLGRKENSKDGKKLVEILVIEEDEDEEEKKPEQVDEGKIEYHDYEGELIQNHPNEAVYVNDYSMLSVQEGHWG